MTVAESHFERFCARHCLQYVRIQEGQRPTPDYSVILNGVEVVVEIKQIDKDESFSEGCSSRTVGDHVRAKINEARNQVRSAGQKGVPAILLIFNNLDPYETFGTDQHDFVAAMYGEPTVAISLETGVIVDSFEGRNKSFRPSKNDSFSAIGHIRCRGPEPTVHLYENIFAKAALDYARLPTCITFSRFEIGGDGAA